MFINVGKNVMLNTNEIAFYCAGNMVPPDLYAKTIDMSGGSKRTFIALNNKVNVFVDLSAQTLGNRISEISQPKSEK